MSRTVRILSMEGGGVRGVMTVVVLLEFWVALQPFAGAPSLGPSTESGGVAYGAYIAGFLVGFGWAHLWRGRNISIPLDSQT